MVILPGVAMRAIQNSTITAPDRICTIVYAYGSPSATPIPTRFNTIAIGTSTNSRSEEHTSELQSLMRISYAVFCLKKKKKQTKKNKTLKKNEEIKTI